MKKQNYTKPCIEIFNLNANDVILSSIVSDEWSDYEDKNELY